MSFLKKLPIRYLVYILIIGSCLVYYNYKPQKPGKKPEKHPRNEQKSVPDWPWRIPKEIVDPYLNDKTKWETLLRKVWRWRIMQEGGDQSYNFLLASILSSISEEFNTLYYKVRESVFKELRKKWALEDQAKREREEKERQIIINVPDTAEAILKNLLEFDGKDDCEKSRYRSEWVKAVAEKLNEHPSLVHDFTNQYYVATDPNVKRIIITMVGMTPYKEAFEFLKDLLQKATDEESFELVAFSICQDGRYKGLLSGDEIRPLPAENFSNIKLNKISEERVDLLISYLYSKEYYKFYAAAALLSDYQYNHPKITDHLIKIARHGVDSEIKVDESRIDIEYIYKGKSYKLSELDESTKEQLLKLFPKRNTKGIVESRKEALTQLEDYGDFNPEINKLAIDVLTNKMITDELKAPVDTFEFEGNIIALNVSHYDELRSRAVKLLKGEENDDYVLELKMSVAMTDPWETTRRFAMDSLSLDKRVFNKVFDRLVTIATSHGKDAEKAISKLDMYARNIKGRYRLHDQEVVDKVVSAMDTIGQIPEHKDFATGLKQNLIQAKEDDRKWLENYQKMDPVLRKLLYKDFENQ